MYFVLSFDTQDVFSNDTTIQYTAITRHMLWARKELAPFDVSEIYGQM